MPAANSDIRRCIAALAARVGSDRWGDETVRLKLRAVVGDGSRLMPDAGRRLWRAGDSLGLLPLFPGAAGKGGFGSGGALRDVPSLPQKTHLK